MRVPLFTQAIVKTGSAEVPAYVGTVAAVITLFRSMVREDVLQEHCVAVALNAKLRRIGAWIVSIGTLSESVVHPREVFRPAIVLGAYAIAVAHNHPSGDPTPSIQDNEVTRRLAAAGTLLGIPLIDHVVIGEGDAFYSYCQRGMLGVS